MQEDSSYMSSFVLILVLLFSVTALASTRIEESLPSSSTPYCQQQQQDNNTWCPSSSATSNHHQPWKWNLDAIHHCNIQRISLQDVDTRFKGGIPPLYSEPLVIHTKGQDRDHTTTTTTTTSSATSIRNTACDYSIFEGKTSFDNITSSLPENFLVTLSSSNSYSAHRRTIPLVQYLNETVSFETFPYQLSNETWYLFGETYSQDWQHMLSDFCLPPCQTCTKDLSALAFGIGGRGSGVQWHTHGPGFSQSIHGRKHWVLYPPDQKPTYDPDFTSRHWMEEVYTGLKDQDDKMMPYECTLFPGDMIYFPDKWYHATINLDRYTVFVSTFTTEHGF